MAQQKILEQVANGLLALKVFDKVRCSGVPPQYKCGTYPFVLIVTAYGMSMTLAAYCLDHADQTEVWISETARIIRAV